MRVREDQRGFTIVELLIAVAILSIVVASVCGFILVGSRSYASANSDINVQQSAQLALNQMSDVLIDTTRSVNYVGYDAGGSPVKVLKDAEFTFTPEDKSLLMYNGVVEENMRPDGTLTTEAKEGNGNRHYQFYWSKQNETLYYAELPVQSGDVDTASISFPAFTAPDPNDPLAPPPAGWVELATHVTDFSVDLTQVEEKRVVMLALTFLDGKKEYVTSNNVTIRNKVGVNDASLEKLDKKKTLAVKIMDKPIVEPGETFHFSVPRVTGTNVADKSVKWSVTLSGSASHGTAFTDDTNGILKVSEDEPSGSVKVTATTNAVDSEGNHASDTVEVSIKRVTSVTLAKTADSDAENGPLEISPGCTFTISANVSGNRLGETCSVCGDDTSIDKQVVGEGNSYGNPYVWLVHNPSSVPGATTTWDPTAYIEILESKEDHATFRLKPDAPVSTDDTEYGVVIQAMSFLSTQDNAHGRHYDNWVPGAIELKFKNSKKNIYVNGNLQWGQGAKIGIDYPGFNSSGQGYYLICARIREYGSDSGEKIMIYRTLGNDTWVTPDLFGVEDIGKPWYLSLQVIDPQAHFQPGVSPSNQPNQNIQQKVKEQIHDQVVLDVIADYLANSPGGTYNGKYPHTDKFEGKIIPPEIFYHYNGQKNLEGELHLNKVVSLSKNQEGGTLDTSFGVDYVKNTKGSDRGGGVEFANNNVKFSVYKEKSGGLEKLYWYDAVNNNYQGNSQPYDGALQLNDVQNARNMIIKLDFNRRNKFAEAEGRYRLIPTIWYAQNPQTDHSYDIYYVDYEPNYGNRQYYEVPASTIYYEMINGGNVDEFWSYYNNRFTKGESYFPTPSDSSFTNYFDRENSSWQNAKKLDEAAKTVNGESGMTKYKPSAMKCRYVADKKIYELELFYEYADYSWDRKMEISAGVFQCPADGDRWKKGKAGPYDSQLERGEKPDPSTANVDFSMNGKNYKGKMYIPLPSESNFTSWLGFKKDSNWQIKDNVSLKYQPDGQGVQGTDNMQLRCRYDAAQDEFTIQVWGYNPATGQWEYRAAFLCKSDENRWRQYGK